MSHFAGQKTLCVPSLSWGEPSRLEILGETGISLSASFPLLQRWRNAPGLGRSGFTHKRRWGGRAAALSRTSMMAFLLQRRSWVNIMRFAPWQNGGSKTFPEGKTPDLKRGMCWFSDKLVRNPGTKDAWVSKTLNHKALKIVFCGKNNWADNKSNKKIAEKDDSTAAMWSPRCDSVPINLSDRQKQKGWIKHGATRD